MSRIYLVGFMGVGKSTVGKQLAKILGYKHLDLDAAIEQKYKINIDLFFKKYGETLFREIEYNLLLGTFDQENMVISTGGGTVTTGDAMDRMNKNGITVYLEMPVGGLVHRLSKAKKRRPLLDGKNEDDLVKTIKHKLAERKPIYSKAQLKADALNIDVRHLSELIQKKLLMAYEGVKYTTIFDNNTLPDDPRIDELRYWCTLFHEKELAPFYPGGTHGNMSFRLDPGKQDIVITSARSSFAKYMTSDSFFTIHNIDFEKLIVHASGASNREPSSETLLHFAIYQKRPDVQAILHGHCKSITLNAEKMGIPTTQYAAESGAMEIVESVLEILDDHSFVEIKDHGFLAMAVSIEEAGSLAMEMLERSFKFSTSK